MKTFISAMVMVLILIGCSYDDSKILAGQQETNNKIDSLMVVIGEPPPLTRVEMIKEKFNGLLAYVYKSVTIETGPEDEDHQLEGIRQLGPHLAIQQSALFGRETAQPLRQSTLDARG